MNVDPVKLRQRLKGQYREEIRDHDTTAFIYLIGCKVWNISPYPYLIYVPFAGDVLNHCVSLQFAQGALEILLSTKISVFAQKIVEYYLPALRKL
jgi:hypothetical protein